MKLTILGSGTLVPSGSRNSAGYFVELPDARIMLDCGAGSLHALARYGLPWERMTHLFISHFHLDHIGELASVLFARRHGTRTSRSGPLTLIGPVGIERVVEGLKMAFGARLFELNFPLNIRPVQSGERLELGPESSLSVAKTLHTDESLAARIEHQGRVLCYTGDTSYDQALARFFNEADVLISECSFLEPRAGVKHLSVAECAKLAAESRARKLIVTHFYFAVEEAELRAKLERNFSGEVIIGRDGLSIEVPTG